MRRLGLVLIIVGMVFLLSGIVAAAWAANQANGMDAEDRALDPDQYDFYVSAQYCSMGSAVIGLILFVIGYFVGRAPAPASKEGQAKEDKKGV